MTAPRAAGAASMATNATTAAVITAAVTAEEACLADWPQGPGEELKREQRNEVGRWRRTGMEEATEVGSGGERGSSAEPEAKMVRIQGSGQAGAGRGQGTQGGAGQRAGTDRQEGKEGAENKEQRTPRRRRTRKKDKKEE